MSDNHDHELVFEKFIKDLEQKENNKINQRKSLAEAEKEWHARKLLKRYREHPLNLRKLGK